MGFQRGLSTTVVGVATFALTVATAGLARAQYKSFANVRPDKVVEIELDNTGISSWRFINRRNPPFIFGGNAAGEPNPADQNLKLRFINNTDRTLKVRMRVKKAIAEPYITPLGSKDRVLECRGSEEACTLVITVHRESVDLPIAVIARFQNGVIDDTLGMSTPASQTPPVAFEVRFFNDVAPVARATGYFLLFAPEQAPAPNQPAHYERPNSTAWELTAAAAVSRDPDFGGEKVTLDASRPYDGAKVWHLPASGALRLRQTLGDRADADATFQYQNGDFGGPEDTRDLKVTKFQTNVYGYRGVILSFGRYTMAEPSDSIAIKEEGDGLQLSFRPLTLSYVVDRESFQAKVDDDDDAPAVPPVDRDKNTLIARLAQLLPGSAKVVRSSELYALYGRENQPGQEYEYATFGGEVQFGGGVRYTASIADYYSWRTARRSSPIADGRGNVLLAKGTKRWLAKPAADGSRSTAATATLTFGHGTAAKSGDGGYAAYTGETASFKPDSLFLSRLAEKRIPAIASSLTNKTYLGLSATTELYSPLQHIAAILGTSADDVAKTTTAQFHVYRLNDAVNDSTAAGSEFDLKFQLESPGGVEQALSIAWFFPGDAVESLFHKRMWTISLGVTVKLF